MFSDFCDCISSLTHLVSQGVNTACLSSGSFPIYQALIPPPRPQFLPKRYKIFSWSNPSTTSPFVLDAPLEALCLLLRSEHTFLRSWRLPPPHHFSLALSQFSDSWLLLFSILPGPVECSVCYFLIFVNTAQKHHKEGRIYSVQKISP